ncbi:MAG: efflux RND transporter periplasmic adaptor subunit [Bryobacterales bacterium]|nr:efflux RND transporter periplasmic adaptor subunit [Bryobacterales bacterium]
MNSRAKLTGVVFACTGVMLFTASVACNREAAADTKKSGKKGMEVVPVAVAKVTARDVPLDVQVIGNVEAFSTVSVKARVTGLIEKVHFREGEYVQKGAMLFTIDPVPFENALAEADANLARSRAQLEQAKANLSRDMAQQKFLASQALRFANLQKEGVISKDQAEQYQANADVAAQAVVADKASIASAEATINSLQATLNTARINLGYTRVKSPVDGRTGNLTAKEGNLATANVTELISISQVQPIYVTFSVPETQLASVKEAMSGGKLPVSATPPDDPATPERGMLTFVDSSVDPSTGTIKLKGTFTNPSRRLWPGQFVRVTLRLGQRAGALMVPNQAVQTGQDGSFVYRVKADSSVEPVNVTTAGRVEQDIIIARGLDVGDTVVTEGQLRLAPGMRVRLRGEGGEKGGGGRKGKRAGSGGAEGSKSGPPAKGD